MRVNQKKSDMKYIAMPQLIYKYIDNTPWLDHLAAYSPLATLPISAKD